MKQLIIAALCAEGANLTTMQPQTGGFFLLEGDTPNAVVRDLTGVTPKELIQVVYKNSKGKLQTSQPFTLSEVVKGEFLGANAGQKQKWTVTPVIPSTQVKGMEWIVKLIDTSGGNVSLEVKTFNVVHTGVDFTAETLCDAFRTVINNGDFDVVASGTTTLILEASTPETHFRVAVDGEMENAAVALTTQNFPACGTAAKMKEIEAMCESYSGGITNKVMYPVVRPDSEIENSDYHQHIFIIKPKYSVKDGSVPTREHATKLYIASTTEFNPLGKVLFDVI